MTEAGTPSASGAQAEKINARNAAPEVLECFWRLASTDEEERQEAVPTLVDAVCKEKDNEALVDYVLNRLIKGLGSGRMASRQGFATALTSLLEHLPQLHTQDVLEKRQEHLNATASLKRSEKRHMQLGQLFFHAALARAGRCLDATTAAAAIEALLQVGSVRSFALHATASIILDICDALPKDELLALLSDCTALKEWLGTAAEAAEPEVLMAALHLWPHLPADLLSATPVLPSGSLCAPPEALYVPPAGADVEEDAAAASDASAAAAAFFKEEHLLLVARCIQQAQYSTAQLHGVWLHLLRLLLPGFVMRVRPGRSESGTSRCGSPGAGQIAALWTCVIDRHLLPSSHERQALALQLFTILLPHLRPSDVPLVFGTNFVQLLAVNLRAPGSYLHKSASRCMHRIMDWIESPTSRKETTAVVLATLARRSRGGRDVKLLQQLTAKMDRPTITQYMQYLQAALLRTEHSGTRGNDDDTDPEWLLSELLAAAQLPACDPDQARSAVRCLAAIALALPGPKAAKSRDAAIQAIAGAAEEHLAELRPLALPRLAVFATSALPCLQSTASGAGPAGKNGAADQPGAHGKQNGIQPRDSLISEVMALMDAVSIAPKRHTELFVATSDAPVTEAIVQLDSYLKACASVSTPASTQMLALLQLLRLSLHSSEPVSAAGVVLDLQAAVEVVCERAGSDADAQHNAQADNDNGAAMEHDAVSVDGGARGWFLGFTECCLSLLQGTVGGLPLSVMRGAVERAWRGLCVHMSAPALKELLAVVQMDRSAVKAGMFELQDDEEEDEDQQGDGDDDDASGTDVDGDDADESEDAGVEEAADDGGVAVLRGSEAGGHPGAAGMRHVDAEVALAALDGRGPGNGGEGEGDDASVDLDDEAMFRLEPHMAAHLRAVQANKQDDTVMLQFRLRALSLLDIWFRKQPQSSLVLHATLPLLTTLRRAPGAGQPEAVGRLVTVLQRGLAQCRPDVSGSLAQEPQDEEQPALPKIIRKVMYYATRADSKEVRAVATALYAMLLRAVLAAQRAGEAAADSLVYGNAKAIAQDMFEKRRTHWKAHTVGQMLAKCEGLARPLLREAVPYACTARSAFLRVDALRTCSLCLRHLHAGSNVDASTATQLQAGLSAAMDGTVATGARWGDALGAVISCCQKLKNLKAAPGQAALWTSQPWNQLQHDVVRAQALPGLPNKCQKLLHQLASMLGAAKGRVKSKAEVKSTGHTPSQNERTARVEPVNAGVSDPASKPSKKQRPRDEDGSNPHMKNKSKKRRSGTDDPKAPTKKVKVLDAAHGMKSD